MIKHSLYAAPLLLMTLSVLCQAQALTRCSVVAVKQKTGSQNLNFSIKPDQHTLSGTFSDIAHTKGYTESDLPPDDKQGRLNDCELKTIVIESISWPWLYANNLLVGYELILTTKNTPLSSTSYSWLPVKVVIALGWLLKSYWNTNSPSFNPITQKEPCQDHPFAAIITMPGSGNDQQQPPPSESSGQQAQEATAGPAGSFNSFLYPDSDSAGDSGGSQQRLHTLGLDCFVSPCHGVCQFRPSSDSSGSAEWPMNSAEHSTGQREAAPEQSSCPHLDTDVPLESDPCPICLIHFHGRDEALVVVKSQCCGHHFDLNCISKCFVDQPIGYRSCPICRQDPMPMVNKNTSESHPDTFFPDWAFYDACVIGDLDQVEKSLAEGVNVNAAIYSDLTPLMLASRKGHKYIVERLINAGADLNARFEDGGTALCIAAQENKNDCVKFLIEAKADVNAQSKNGITPLLIAAHQGHTDILKSLIEAKADLNAPAKNGATPLFVAAQEGNNDCVKLLIEAKADLSIQTESGANPLFIAAQKNQTDCLKILIEAKADLYATTSEGTTPLCFAAMMGDANSVQQLIDTGADLEAAMSDGITPLFMAALMGNTNCLQILIDAGADFNARAKTGTTPLLMALMRGNTECVKALIVAKADVNISTPKGTTPLFIAVLMRDANCVQLLIDAGANVNAVLSNGDTPLSIATELGYTDCVNLLINAGAE